MKFNEIIFALPDEKSYDAEEALAALGFHHFFIEKNPGEDTKLKCYFDADDENLVVLEALQGISLEILNRQELEEMDWLSSWIATLDPIELTPDIWVNPYPDQDIEAPAGSIVMNIVPGTAFGTGLHATTKLAARLLADQDIAGKSVIDVGCGTGVLALLAKKKGAGKVIAVDDDMFAIQKSKEIFKKHDVEVELFQSNLLKQVKAEKPYDFVVANIICEVLLDMVEQEQWLNVFGENSLALFSGISRVKRDSFEARAKELNWNILEHREEGDWNAYLFKR